MTASSGAASSGETFNIGFALSGAVSAGAYTAGVLDYFFQALDEWGKAKKAEEPGTPQHQVSVQVIAGASAGAITGALGVVALARGIRPQKLSDAERSAVYPTETGTMQDIRCVLPALYQTWVVGPRMVGPQGGTDFLSSEDLGDTKNGSPVVSVLNARLLDQIKQKALLAPDTPEPPEAGPPYRYIAENLHVYMTVSNLRGIPFTVKFPPSEYGMQTHGDRIHYTIRGLGTGNSASNHWLDADSFREIEIRTLPERGQGLPREWDWYGDCALASSAFPIGLAPRQIAAQIAEFRRRSYPIPHGDAVIEPSFPASLSEFVFLTVDGGVINNNPFDYAQYTLLGSPEAKAEQKDADEADRAVIMVSPFPEPPAFLPEGQPPTEIVAVLRALFPALINQARFKLAEIAPALDSGDHSRFLIVPQRQIGEVEQKYKIACGLLGGFGGFLDEKFRAHDFQLGRRNCQRFLQATFGVTIDNAIMQGLPNPQDYALSPGAGKYRIIPRLGNALPEVALPEWPRMSQADFNTLMDRISGRLGRVAPRFVQAQTKSRFFRALGRTGLRLARRRVLQTAKLAILSDLVRRDQIEGWALPTSLPKAPGTSPDNEGSADDARMVLAELANPAFTFRTVDGIARRTHLDRGFVADILNEFQKPLYARECYLVWQSNFAGRQVFTLASRAPNRISMLPPIRKIADLFEAPMID